jgi:L-arabonate dehydrase
MTKKKAPHELRSQQWFGRQDRDGFAYRSWVKGKGVPHDQFDGRPVIGICNTFSELTPCNSHFRTLAEQVKIGVYEAGGFPARVPGDVARRDAAAPHRHALPQPRQHGRRGVIRGNPVDGVVLLMGCDKTTPSAADGRGQRRPADHRRVRRADAQRQAGAASSSARAPACGA